MLFVLLPLAVIAAVSTGVSIGVRRASDDPDRWHVDPTTAEPTGNPNWYRLTPDAAPADRNSERDGSSPLFDTDVATLSATFDAVALGDDRVEVLAGAAADGFVTYVQRSALFGFPDYVSVTFGAADGGGSTATAAWSSGASAPSA